MNQQNLVILEGNAYRDAEVKHTNSGALIGKMSIVVNRLYKSGGCDRTHR
jgi:single-stranded DNA-binding protein